MNIAVVYMRKSFFPVYSKHHLQVYVTRSAQLFILNFKKSYRMIMFYFRSVHCCWSQSETNNTNVILYIFFFFFWSIYSEFLEIKKKKEKSYSMYLSCLEKCRLFPDEIFCKIKNPSLKPIVFILLNWSSSFHERHEFKNKKLNL